LRTVAKGTTGELIFPPLSKGRRNFKSEIPLGGVVTGIFYRLEAGCQWLELPLKQVTGTAGMSWESVYYYFNKKTKV